MLENIIKALDSAAFAVGDLRAALHTATAVEGYIIMGLLKRAVELERDINKFLSAEYSDGAVVKIAAAENESEANHV